MAIVTATITVDFTAFFVGAHRICWRVQGSGDPYDCTTIVNCVGGGTTCQGVFNADVNTTSCDGIITFEGYVQATCEDVLSTNGRLDWTVDFTPTLECQNYIVTCESVSVEALVLTGENNGYDPLFPPAVTIGVPDIVGGIQATGTATVSNNSIRTVGATIGGNGYPPNSTFVDHPTVVTFQNGPNVGTGFLVTITTDGAGNVNSVDLNDAVLAGGNGGSNYNVGDVIGLDPAGPAGPSSGTPFETTVQTLSTGVVTSLVLTDPGSGYTSNPTLTIDPPISGIPATGDVFIFANCPLFDIGNDCVGGDLVCLTTGLPVGNSFTACIEVGTELPIVDGYVVTEGLCCIPGDTSGDPCVYYDIENLSGATTFDVQYTACEGDNVILTIPTDTNLTICAVDGGVNAPVDPKLIITNTGTPCT